jgi:phytol kinase
MKEFLRQIAHLVFGLGIAFFILLVAQEATTLVMMLAIFSGFILSDAVSRGYYIPLVSEVVNLMERREAVPGKGALYFALGALFCLIFFSGRIVFLGLAVLSVLDSTTTIFGMRFGKTRIYNGKSLEGTVSGVLITTAFLLPFIPPAIALVVAGVSGLIELFSPVDDNLVIPVGACLLLIFLL